MYEIDIYYRGDRAKELCEPMAKLLTRCGLTFCMEITRPTPSASGGRITLKQLRFPKASQLLRGRSVYEDSAQDRIQMLLHRLTKSKPFEGRIWFPSLDTKASIRCSGQLHNLVHKNNHLSLCSHRKGQMELDRAMSVLAQADKPPKCLRILDAWKRVSSIEEDRCRITMPAAFRNSFRQAIWKHHLRRTINCNIEHQVDRLTLSREQRWGERAHKALWKALGHCQYSNKFINVVNSIWSGGVRFTALIHSGPAFGSIWEGRSKSIPSICLEIDNKIAKIMHTWHLDAKEEDKTGYVLHIFMPHIVDWYAKTFLRGVAVVEGNLVLQSHRIDDAHRWASVVRYYDTALGKRLVEEPALIFKDGNNNWKLRWENDRDTERTNIEEAICR